MGLSLALALWVCMWATVGSASAAPARTAAVAPIVWQGQAQPEAIPVLQARLDKALRVDAEKWIPAARVAAAIAGKRGACVDIDCLRSVASTVSADYLLLATITLRDRVYQVTLEAIDVETGGVRAESSEFCEICGLRDVGELVHSQATAMLPTLSALLHGLPTFAVTSVPPGAVVMVDGKRLGTTPLTGELAPGRHTVRVELEGRVPQEQEILAVEGEHETLSVELPEATATPAVDPAGRRRRGFLAGGGASLGIGLALVGAGVPLIVIDGRQNMRRCSGNDVDVNGTCRFSYETLAGGAALVAVGGALTVVGVGLLAATAKRRKPTAASLRLGLSPASVALTGRF